MWDKLMLGLTHAQLRSSGPPFSQKRTAWRSRAISEQLHRLEPEKAAGDDGASAGQVTAVRVARRRARRSSDQQMIAGPGHRCMTGAKPMLGIARKERPRTPRSWAELLRRPGGSRVRLQPCRGCTFSMAARRLGAAVRKSCRRSGDHPALPGSQAAQRRRSPARRTQAGCAQETAERLRDDRTTPTPSAHWTGCIAS